MQVAFLDDVGVKDRQVAHACAGKRGDDAATKASGADDSDAGTGKARLSFGADLGQGGLAKIAAHLVASIQVRVRASGSGAC